MNYLKRIELQEKVNILNDEYQQLKAKNEIIDSIDEFNLKSLYRDLKEAVKELEKVNNELNELQCKLNSIEENAPR